MDNISAKEEAFIANNEASARLRLIADSRAFTPNLHLWQRAIFNRWLKYALPEYPQLGRGAVTPVPEPDPHDDSEWMVDWKVTPKSTIDVGREMGQ